MSLRLMKERIKQSGISLYDEQIKDAQDILAYGFEDDVSYNKNICIYNTNDRVTVKMYDQKYSASYGFTSKFLSPHNVPIGLGELLHDTKKNEYWLCVESYDVSGIHNEGKLGKCSRFIKWQESDGSIQEIPVIARNATQYNNGEYKDETVTLGSDQLMLYTQLNSHTKKLDHGVKFFMDENMENPTVYELTKPDTVDYSYMGKGMMSIMLTERPYTPTDEELRLGICNYHKPTPSPLPPQPPVSNETANLTAYIEGNRNLKNGYPRTYTAILTDKNEEIIEWDDNLYSWSVVSDFAVKQDVSGNKIKLEVDDEAMIGSSFLLQITDKSKKNTIHEINITVTELVSRG